MVGPLLRRREADIVQGQRVPAPRYCLEGRRQQGLVVAPRRKHGNPQYPAS
jgi:hypothetical protein